MSDLSYSQIHKNLSVLLPQASQIACKYFLKKTDTLYKDIHVNSQPAVSVLTEADKKTEDFLISKLNKLYPEIGYIGEESKKIKIKKYNWIIDPIDGTLNFIWGIPLFCHSVALWKENEAVYAAVYLPFTKQLVHAFKDGGLYLNNKLVKRNSKKSNTSYILYAIVGSAQEKEQILSKLTLLMPLFRHFGSAVYHGVLNSLGEVKASLCFKTGFWDLAAIVLFAKEAGLHCEFISPKPDIHDKDVKDYKYSFVMGEKKLALKLAKQLKDL